MPRKSSQSEEKEKKVPLTKAFAFYGKLFNYKSIFIPSLIALFLTAALSLAFPYFLTELVGQPMDALRNGIDLGKISERIDTVVLTLLGILGLQAGISFFRVQGFIRAGESALNDVRTEIFSHMVRLPMSYHMDQRAGELSGRVATDLGILRDTLLTTVPSFVRHIVILVGGLIFVFITSTKLSLVMLSCIPVVVLAVAIIGKKIRVFSRAAQDSLSDSQVVVEEAMQGVSAVKTFTNELLEEGRYRSALEAFLRVTFRGALARAAFVSFIIFVMMGTIAAVIWFGAKMMISGELSSEEFTRFIMFSIFVAASIGSLPEIVSQFQKTAGATDRLQEMLSVAPEEIGKTSEPIKSGEIQLKGVNFTYPGTLRPVLSDLDLHIKAGERVAIVGPSGAGKSTLFSLLLNFYTPQEGSVSLDGRDVQELGVTTTREAMAIVPQDVILFGGSVLENIRYGRPQATSDEVVEAARLANALMFIEELPDGFDTLVGPRGMKLSGGQRQRIAIARAILADPRILLLDEATSALDSESERLVQEALDVLMQGRTSLIIAHRLSTVRDVDRIFVISGGTVVETGRHQELIDRKGMYHVLAQTQLL